MPRHSCPRSCSTWESGRTRRSGGTRWSPGLQGPTRVAERGRPGHRWGRRRPSDRHPSSPYVAPLDCWDQLRLHSWLRLVALPGLLLPLGPVRLDLLKLRELLELLQLGILRGLLELRVVLGLPV